MRVSFVSLLFALFTTFPPATFSQTSMSVTYTYARLSYPGAPITKVNGINNQNVIVGWYYDSQYSVHGFEYRAGKFSPINLPG